MVTIVSAHRQRSSRFGSRRRFNTRLLLYLLGGCACSAVLVHFLHDYQLNVNTDALRVRAEQLVEDDKLPEAIKRYRQYLMLRPSDVDSWAKMGELIDQTAKTPRDLLRAYLAFENVL